MSQRSATKFEQGFSIVTITPQIAAEILARNENNRNLRPSRVSTYARDMRLKKWKLNGDVLRFNGRDDRLVDGQHRLAACVQADTPFTTGVYAGLEAEAHATVDTGLGRKMSDELKWRGERNTASLAAVLSLLWLYDQGSTGANVPSRADLLGLLEKNAEVRESLALLTPMNKIGLRGTAVATLHFIMRREHGLQVADEFASELISGTGYVEGDPALALRNYAINVAGSRLSRPTTLEWLAVTIKAANAWLLGRPVKQVRWRRVGPAREPFPQLVGVDER